MIFATHQLELATVLHVSVQSNPESPPHPIPLGFPRAPALNAFIVHKFSPC